eukprot:6189867-Pleurochrysis_carterae.AAC.2
MYPCASCTASRDSQLLLNESADISNCQRLSSSCRPEIPLGFQSLNGASVTWLRRALLSLNLRPLETKGAVHSPGGHRPAMQRCAGRDATRRAAGRSHSRSPHAMSVRQSRPT